MGLESLSSGGGGGGGACLRGGGGGCEQNSCRPAWASMQSDQRLCYLRFENFVFLVSLCSWAGWFESHFVGNPEDRFCRNEA